MVRQRWPIEEVNVAKSVSLRTGRAFETVTAAKDHFVQILNGQELKQEFAGDELSDIRAIYEDYCAKTGWELQSPLHPSTPRTIAVQVIPLDAMA
jgi:hypothetical protein